MKRYFVKAHFGGWKEVPADSYNRFIENIMKHAGGINEQQKEKYIKQVTKIIVIEGKK